MQRHTRAGQETVEGRIFARHPCQPAGRPFHSPANGDTLILSHVFRPSVRHWLISPLHLPVFSLPPLITTPSPPLTSTLGEPAASGPH